MVQRAMGGPEISIDCLGDRDGRCLNAIPRTMLESRGGESIKGQVIRDEELIELGRRTMETLRVRGPATIQVFRDPDVGLGITDVNTRFGGAFPAPVYAALPGRTYPELIVRMAAGETVEPHVGEFRHGADVHPLLLAARARRAPAAHRPRHRARRPARTQLIGVAAAEAARSPAVKLELEPVATLLADSPTAPSDEPKAPDASQGAPQAPPNGAAPAPAGTPDSPVAPAPVAHACARCGAAMAPGRTGACSAAPALPAAIGSPSWRSAATILARHRRARAGRRRRRVRRAQQDTRPPRTWSPPPSRRPPRPPSPCPRRPRPTRSAAPAPIPTLPETTIQNPRRSRSARPNCRAPKTTTTRSSTPAPSKRNQKPTPTRPKPPPAGRNEPKPVAIVLDTNAAATYNPYDYPAGGFGDPSLTIDGDTSTGVDRAGRPRHRAQNGRGRADRPEGAAEALRARAHHLDARHDRAGLRRPGPDRAHLDHRPRVGVAQPLAAWPRRSTCASRSKTPTRRSTSSRCGSARPPPPVGTAQAPGHVSVNELELFPAE